MVITKHKAGHPASGMSLIELLVVVAIVAILSALLVPNIGPMRGATSTQIARQQQAELQTALGAWIAAESAKPGGLAAARAAYGSGSLDLLANYLQPATYANLSGSGSAVTSEALNEAGASLQFSAWGSGGPSVNWVAQ